jgi:hypothetical protein
MTPEQVLSHPARVLSQEQREFYFREGYLLVPKILPDEWIRKLRAVSDEFVAKSRSVTKSDPVFDLEPDHRPDAPRLRRVSNPDQHHPVVWEYATRSILADVVSDLVGPDVKFHHAKLNYKWAKGGEEVKWHYDIGFWPHTNYSPLTVGTLLYDCGMEQGPLGVIPRSHEWDLAPQYDDNGKWIGCLNDRDLAKVDLAKAKYLTGPAGSLTIHNCRTLHGSPRNESDTGRPLLLFTMASADALPYTANPIKPEHAETVIRGKRAKQAHIDPRPCPLPPDWSKGYSSIFALQQKEASAMM